MERFGDKRGSTCGTDGEREGEKDLEKEESYRYQ